MKKLMKYETPEIEVTRFHIKKSIMADFGGGAGDGDEVTDFINQSLPDDSPTKPTFDFDQKGAQKHEK